MSLVELHVCQHWVLSGLATTRPAYHFLHQSFAPIVVGDPLPDERIFLDAGIPTLPQRTRDGEHEEKAALKRQDKCSD